MPCIGFFGIGRNLTAQNAGDLLRNLKRSELAARCWAGLARRGRSLAGKMRKGAFRFCRDEKDCESPRKGKGALKGFGRQEPSTCSSPTAPSLPHFHLLPGPEPCSHACRWTNPHASPCSKSCAERLQAHGFAGIPQRLASILTRPEQEGKTRLTSNSCVALDG